MEGVTHSTTQPTRHTIAHRGKKLPNQDLGSRTRGKFPDLVRKSVHHGNG